MATIKEIARLAGVSRGTVDRVLNNRGSVNPATAQKICDIADALDYKPNRLGKRLAIKKKNLRFGCVLFGSTQSNPYIDDVAAAIKRKSKEMEDYGVTVEMRYAPLIDPLQLSRHLDQLVENGVNGIVLTPSNNPYIADKINELSDIGIPVVTIDSDLPDCKRLAYVGSDSCRSGRTAANIMELITGGRARVGVVMGSSMIKNHCDRVHGFESYVAEQGLDIKIVQQITNHDDDIESYSKTKEMLQSHPEIDSLFLASAGVAGACKAVQDLHLTGRFKIVSFDTVPSTIQLVKSGVIAATIGQQPEVQGAKALDILLDYLGMNISPARDKYLMKVEIKLRENI